MAFVDPETSRVGPGCGTVLSLDCDGQRAWVRWEDAPVGPDPCHVRSLMRARPFHDPEDVRPEQKN